MRPGRVALAQSWEVLPAALAADAGAGVPEEPEGGEGGLGAAASRVEELLHSALSQGTEGLMLKALDGSYEPSRRSESWVKLKKDYCAGLADSVDVVPIGAWWGSGRKAGWFSPFLLAVYNPESEQWESLCRCMSGFSDDFYREATERWGLGREGPRPAAPLARGERGSLVRQERPELKASAVPAG